MDQQQNRNFRQSSYQRPYQRQPQGFHPYNDGASHHHAHAATRGGYQNQSYASRGRPYQPPYQPSYQPSYPPHSQYQQPQTQQSYQPQQQYQQRYSGQRGRGGYHQGQRYQGGGNDHPFFKKSFCVDPWLELMNPDEIEGAQPKTDDAVPQPTNPIPHSYIRNAHQNPSHNEPSFSEDHHHRTNPDAESDLLPAFMMRPIETTQTTAEHKNPENPQDCGDPDDFIPLS